MANTKQEAALGKLAYAALLHNGEKQILPVSKASLIELADTSNSNTYFGENKSVQHALEQLYGLAKLSQTNSYAYTGSEIAKAIGALDSEPYGAAKAQGADYGTKYVSYIYEEDGIIKGEASDLTASAVVYAGDGGRTTVADELTYLNTSVSQFAQGAGLKVSYTGMDTSEDANYDVVIAADGREYTLTQGEKTIAKFNIEKDSFVKDGEVVRGHLLNNNVYSGPNADALFVSGTNSDPEQPPVDTYFMHLTIGTSDANETHLFIPAESLVDAYNADNAGHNVTVTIDDTKNTIGAVVNQHGITSNELAADSVTTEKIADSNVTTAKIADGSVTYGKLGNDVTLYLTKADTALQKSNITTGVANGTISVDGDDVAVKGLLNIAYTGLASDVNVTTDQTLTDLATLVGQSADVDDVQGTLQTLAKAVTTLNTSSVHSITGSTYKSNDTTFTITPSQNTGDVTLSMTHNLGNVATLNYDGKDYGDAISSAFYSAI